MSQLTCCCGAAVKAGLILSLAGCPLGFAATHLVSGPQIFEHRPVNVCTPQARSPDAFAPERSTRSLSLPPSL